MLVYRHFCNLSSDNGDCRWYTQRRSLDTNLATIGYRPCHVTLPARAASVTIARGTIHRPTSSSRDLQPLFRDRILACPPSVDVSTATSPPGKANHDGKAKEEL